jgi:hypothetical protein
VGSQAQASPQIVQKATGPLQAACAPQPVSRVCSDACLLDQLIYQ